MNIFSLCQHGNSPMNIALIEDNHECIICLERQYSQLQAELEEAKRNLDDRDGLQQFANELLREFRRQQNP